MLYSTMQCPLQARCQPAGLHHSRQLPSTAAKVRKAKTVILVKAIYLVQPAGLGILIHQIDIISLGRLISDRHVEN